MLDEHLNRPWYSFIGSIRSYTAIESKIIGTIEAPARCIEAFRCTAGVCCCERQQQWRQQQKRRRESQQHF